MKNRLLKNFLLTLVLLFLLVLQAEAAKKKVVHIFIGDMEQDTKTKVGQSVVGGVLEVFGVEHTLNPDPYKNADPLMKRRISELEKKGYTVVTHDAAVHATLKKALNDPDTVGIEWYGHGDEGELFTPAGTPIIPAEIKSWAQEKKARELGWTPKNARDLPNDSEFAAFLKSKYPREEAMKHLAEFQDAHYELEHVYTHVCASMDNTELAEALAKRDGTALVEGYTGTKWANDESFKDAMVFENGAWVKKSPEQAEKDREAASKKLAEQEAKAAAEQAAKDKADMEKAAQEAKDKAEKAAKDQVDDQQTDKGKTEDEAVPPDEAKTPDDGKVPGDEEPPEVEDASKPTDPPTTDEQVTDEDVETEMDQELDEVETEIEDTLDEVDVDVDDIIGDWEDDDADDVAPPAEPEPTKDPIQDMEGDDGDVDIDGIFDELDSLVDDWADALESDRDEDFKAGIEGMEDQNKMDTAENAGQADRDKANSIREYGEGEASETRDQSALDTAAGNRENSIGKVIGDAVEAAVTEGLEATGKSFGGEVGSHLAGEIFDDDDKEVAADAGPVPAPAAGKTASVKSNTAPAPSCGGGTCSDGSSTPKAPAATTGGASSSGGPPKTTGGATGTGGSKTGESGSSGESTGEDSEPAMEEATCSWCHYVMKYKAGTQPPSNCPRCGCGPGSMLGECSVCGHQWMIPPSGGSLVCPACGAGGAPHSEPSGDEE